MATGGAIGLSWGTWFINISGCFAIGTIAGLASAGVLSPSAR